MSLSLQPCEGEAHTGETTLTADEVRELRNVLEDENVEARQVVNVAKTLLVTLSHEADKELVNEAMRQAGKGRRGLGQATAYLMTVMDRVFPKQGGSRKFPEQFSTPLRKVLKAVSLGEPHVMGSSDDHKVMYSGDYDLLETSPLNVRGFKALVKRANRVGTITDIKVGEVPEWQMLRGEKYNRQAELDHLGKLWQGKVVTDEEVRQAKKVLKEHMTPSELVNARKELRFGVLRWTPKEVASGIKKYRGRTFRLEEAMKSPGITKVDVVAWVKDKYVEVSNIILWTHGRETYADLPELAKSLGEDLLYYEAEGRYMKVAKRMYSLAKVKGFVQDQEDLLDILNSQLGALYSFVSDLEVLEEFPEAVTAERKRHMLDLMRDRMAKLFYGEFDSATDPRKVMPRVKEVLEEETRKTLEKKKLLPLSASYKPRTS